MAKLFRVIDTGVRDGREQIAFDQALIDLHREGVVPDTIRFLQFPPTALIGRHQALSQELKLDYCRANNIRTVRRITGGGALYFDEGQLGWELVFDRATLGTGNLGDLARIIGEAAALGLRNLGVEAQYRAPNDVEVGGRKISGGGGFFDGNTLFYQGTVLVDMDPADMIATLNIPDPAVARQFTEAAAQRIVTVKELLGTAPDMAAIKQAMVAGFRESLGIEPVAGAITDREEAETKKLFDEEIGTDEFVAEIDNPANATGILTGTHAAKGGRIAAHIRLEGASQDRFREVLITGDFFVAPPRIVLDLEAALRGTPAGEVRKTVEAFFAKVEIGLMTVSPDDFIQAIELALGASE
jgi:lipoate---protein ligase